MLIFYFHLDTLKVASKINFGAMCLVLQALQRVKTQLAIEIKNGLRLDIERYSGVPLKLDKARFMY